MSIELKILEATTKAFRKWGKPWLEVAVDHENKSLALGISGELVARYTFARDADRDVVVRSGKTDVAYCFRLTWPKITEDFRDQIAEHMLQQFSRQILAQVPEITKLKQERRSNSKGKLGTREVKLGIQKEKGDTLKLFVSVDEFGGEIPEVEVTRTDLRKRTLTAFKKQCTYLIQEREREERAMSSLALLGEYLKDVLKLKSTPSDERTTPDGQLHGPGLDLEWKGFIIGTVYSPVPDKPYVLAVGGLPTAVSREALKQINAVDTLLLELTPAKLAMKVKEKLVVPAPDPVMDTGLDLV